MPILVTAVVWFLLGFGFHAWLIWYDKRREAREAKDRVLTGLRVYWKTGQSVYVVRDPLMLTDIRETVN